MLRAILRVKYLPVYCPHIPKPKSLSGINFFVRNAVTLMLNIDVMIILL